MNSSTHAPSVTFRLALPGSQALAKGIRRNELDMMSAISHPARRTSTV